MTTWEGNDVTPATAGRPPGAWRGVTRGWLLALAGVAAVGGGVALKWGWLTAVGAAPLILSVLPCAAMCALGLCMRGGSKASCSGSRPAEAETPPSGGIQR